MLMHVSLETADKHEFKRSLMTERFHVNSNQGISSQQVKYKINVKYTHTHKHKQP